MGRSKKIRDHVEIDTKNKFHIFFPYLKNPLFASRRLLTDEPDRLENYINDCSSMSLGFVIVRLLDIYFCVLQKVGIFLTAFFKSKFQAISTRFPPYLLKIPPYLFFKCFDSAYNRLWMGVLVIFGSEENLSSGCKLMDHAFG